MDTTERNECSLFPYERTEIVSVQEAKQLAGWMISAFDLPSAWAITQGDGVKVAVLDTGCDLDHPDLAANLLPGINIISPGNPPNDDCGHGTHVCGIIAAINNGIGMIGVAPRAQVIPIKVLDGFGNGMLAGVANGIMAALDRGADIITMSLGSPSPMPQLHKVLQLADQRGVAVFVAAGNAGKTQNVYYPAVYPETICIGAIDQKLQRAPFSSTGRRLDFMAPGVDIFSTVPDNWYAMMSGSSMATPFVAGVAALLLSYTRSRGIILPNAAAFRERLRAHCHNLNGEGAGDPFYGGYGIIDIKGLFSASDEAAQITPGSQGSDLPPGSA